MNIYVATDLKRQKKNRLSYRRVRKLVNYIVSNTCKLFFKTYTGSYEIIVYFS